MPWPIELINWHSFPKQVTVCNLFSPVHNWLLKGPSQLSDFYCSTASFNNYHWLAQTGVNVSTNERSCTVMSAILDAVEIRQLTRPFWILAFQRPISKYYFWSQVYKHLQVVVIVLWKWSFLAFLQGKVVKFSRPVAGVRPGVKITFLPLKAFNILPWSIPNWKIKWANNFYICP